MNERFPIFSGLNPFGKLLFSALGVIVIGLASQLIALLLATTIFDVSAFDLVDMNGTADQELISAVKFLQIIGALGTFIVSSLLLSYFYTGSWLGYFLSDRKIAAGALGLIILVMITALPFVNLLTELNMRFELPFDRVEQYLRRLEDDTQTLMMTLIKAEITWALLVNLLMFAIIPAVGEELVFRGLIQRHLTGMFRNGHVAIIVASVIFSLAHLQFYSFLPRFFLGLILGYTFYYGKSIWYPVIAHLANNTMGVLFYFFYHQEKAGPQIEEIGTSDMMPVTAMLSLVLVGVLMYVWINVLKINPSAQRGLRGTGSDH